jgi:hypothetical protein
MTTFLKRLITTLHDWLASTVLEPLTPAHGWLLPEPRTLLLLRQPLRNTGAIARLRA